MCGVGSTMAMPGMVAGASGGGAPGKSGVAGASGGGGIDLTSVLSGLRDAVQALAELVSKMGTSGGGGGMAGCPMAKSGVMGVRGGAATKTQFVAPVAAPVVRSISGNGGGEDDPFEAEVLRLINDVRRNAGLGEITYNASLDNAAEGHASFMAQVGKMAHDGIGDNDPGTRIRTQGFNKAWGENVATGQRSPEQVVREWMASPTHKRNIMDPNFKQMGVGMVTAQNGQTYWAQEFGA